MSDERPRVISRRELLRRAGLASAAAVAGPTAALTPTPAPASTESAVAAQAPASAAFFALVLSHTRQGMFGDPYYGGNANFAGWDLLGYPGVRTMVTAADQRAYEAGQLAPNHKSAYDYETFTKATARLAPEAHEERGHGHET